MRLALAIVAVVLFFSNYQVCEFFYKNDIDAWWKLKQNIYNAIIAICFYLARHKTSGLIRFILDIGIGLSISNCIDRIFFDITSFQANDILMVVLTILTTYADMKQWLSKQ